jgi:hypothetical protein
MATEFPIAESGGLATIVAIYILAVLNMPPAQQEEGVAALAARMTHAIEADPDAATPITAGLRQALATALTDPARATERVTTILAIFNAALARVAQDIEVPAGVPSEDTLHTFAREYLPQ